VQQCVGGQGGAVFIRRVLGGTLEPTLAIGWRYFWIKQRQIVTDGKHSH